ncbi:MAG: type I-C CRISPR-associated endonuclease Cas1c [Xanthomonadales bacterium]|nr:type I-C CRISPR-associated endonuclease Cas1c [Xanthomonadales bacterium]
MKKLLNTLYIHRQETYLHKERETIVVKQAGEKLAQFPALTIANIVCFGQVSVSPFLMAYCAERGMGVSFYSEFGKYLARVEGRQTGNVLLRRQQYRWADDVNAALRIARVIIAAKVRNTRSVLLREQRNHGEVPTLKATINHLETSLRNVKSSVSIEQLLGIEGDAANRYFSCFPQLIRNKEFKFEQRVRRPPTDAVNALLSFVYSLMSNECASALQGVGLDPYVGFLHQDRPGRLSLALDILEEFRPVWADRFVLTLINRRQVKPKDFIQESSGAVRLKDDARKALLSAWQERKKVEVQHPYLEEKVATGLLPHCQALLIARHLRGDLEYYPPYVMK